MNLKNLNKYLPQQATLKVQNSRQVISSILAHEMRYNQNSERSFYWLGITEVKPDPTNTLLFQHHHTEEWLVDSADDKPLKYNLSQVEKLDELYESPYSHLLLLLHEKIYVDGRQIISVEYDPALKPAFQLQTLRANDEAVIWLKQTYASTEKKHQLIFEELPKPKQSPILHQQVA